MEQVNGKWVVCKAEIPTILEEWRDQMHSSPKLVHVDWFQLSPLAQGFSLRVNYYIADKYDPEYGSEEKQFFGTMEECFGAALQYAEDQRMRLKKLL